MYFKTLLNEPSNIIICNNNDYIKNIKIGNNDFVFDKTVLKSFFINNNNNKLIVILSAVGGALDTYPIFHRISWHDKFLGIKIYFDDPTREMIKFGPCFYFGKLKNNCLHHIKDVVEKIKNYYGLTNEDITFLSSSNGGFGCLYLSNEFHGSKCIALCPQLDIKLFFGETGFNLFKDKTEIYNEKVIPLIYDRLNLYRIANNHSSKFIIYSNIACASDKKQIDEFCKYLQCNYSLGLNQLNSNLYLIIVSMDNVDPHSVQPDENFCGYLNNYFWNDDDKRKFEMVNYFINMMGKVNELNFKTKLIGTLFSGIPDFSKIIIKRLERGDLDIHLNKNVYLRINNSKNGIIPSLRINKSNIDLDMNIIRDHVRSSNDCIDEKEVWINIFKKEKVSIDECRIWFSNLIKLLGIMSE